MRLAQVNRASQYLRDVLDDDGTANLVYLSAMVPPAHKKLLEGLAQLNRGTQAAVLRAILDEWCEAKLAAIEAGVNGSGA